MNYISAYKRSKPKFSYSLCLLGPLIYISRTIVSDHNRRQRPGYSVLETGSFPEPMDDSCQVCVISIDLNLQGMYRPSL